MKLEKKTQVCAESTLFEMLSTLHHSELYAVMLVQRLLRGSFSDSAVEACARKGGVGRTDAAPAERVEDPATHARLLALLSSRGLSFSTLAHVPTRTSEESAAVRGVPLASGAKAMLLKASKPLPHGSPYLLAVLSAARKADLRALRCALAQKSVSLASVDDVWRLTGCVPGAVPPFGSLFAGVKTYVDPSLVEQGEFINFNSALRGSSVIGLRTADFLRVEQPIVLAFSEPM